MNSERTLRGGSWFHMKALRGGSWNGNYYNLMNLRSSRRNCDPPAACYINVGFRLVGKM